MDIGYLIDRGSISPRVSTPDKRQALSVIAEIAGRHYGIRPATVLAALVKREAQGSTGIGHGVATPHARLRGLSKMSGVFVRLESPIAFGSIDDQPVDLLFALLAPAEATAAEHLQALAKVSRVLGSGELRQQLRQANTVDALHALLVRDAQASAA